MAENIHPSFDIQGSDSTLLAGKRIILCIAGSVAAIRSPDIARKLLRHGADVFPVMSDAATRIIHPDIMHWATGHKAVTQLTGEIEHVARAGNVRDTADLMLLAPATANTIGKIAAGIDDTPVTTFITTGLGEGIPLVIVPAMHLSMYNHPIVQENIEKLKKIGITVLMPEMSEGKAKIAPTDAIIDTITGILGGERKLSGKKVLITLGRTVEYIDPIRVITNNSTGKMGASLAAAAAYQGAEVTIIAGKHSVPLPGSARVVSVNTADEMMNAAVAECSRIAFDVVIAAAAVGDFKPKTVSAEKISTHINKSISLDLVPTPKILDIIKDHNPKTFLVAFRAVAGLSKKARTADAQERMKKARADCIVVNDTAVQGAGFETDTNEVEIITAGGEVFFLPQESKKTIAVKILDIIAAQLEQKR
ncbi:MAG: bifunctional phosphopantothenoylcysteine decarboxylase/phosphopantothenate--cysteine ligase CoaBC [Spirochaetales bacterium]|nr:bifunctional phosphopantothenoylcysteine decarboxylase/phosphopantothenate--cysteine ligase CoaBC [Spirochaetales bacterium]